MLIYLQFYGYRHKVEKLKVKKACLYYRYLYKIWKYNENFLPIHIFKKSVK